MDGLIVLLLFVALAGQFVTMILMAALLLRLSRRKWGFRDEGDDFEDATKGGLTFPAVDPLTGAEDRRPKPVVNRTRSQIDGKGSQGRPLGAKAGR